MSYKNILITGGCGFIGSNFIKTIYSQDLNIINLDRLSYAGNTLYLQDLADKLNYHFYHGDINNEPLISEIIGRHNIDAIIHFAAETHVDRSITKPDEFVQNNVLGTFHLLEVLRRHDTERRIKFIHISTDEVYGDLQPHDPLFNEESAYKPNSPYSASKAASDHFVRAYHKTFKLQTCIIHCSNIYGPHQYPEKLIPVIVKSALTNTPIPVYGRGENIRDWLYVKDAARGIECVLQKGQSGQTYNIAGENEIRNLDLVKMICHTLDKITPRKSSKSYAELITFVTDRPGHDFRYGMEAEKTKTLGWQTQTSFENGIQETIAWFVEQFKGDVS